MNKIQNCTQKVAKTANSLIQTVNNRKTALNYALLTTVTTGVLTTPVAMAAGAGGADVNQIVGKILGVITNIFFYIGILLLAWSIGMLVLAFKNEDADSKSRSMMLLVVSAVLIGLKPLLSAVLDGTGVSIGDVN